MGDWGLARQAGRRPIRYTDKAAQEICQRIAMGESLRRVCEDRRLPILETVLSWLFGGKHDRFRLMYRQARQAQAELFADELVTIADDACDRDSLAIAKLRTDVRRWVIGRMLPSGSVDDDGDTGAIHGAASHEAALRVLLETQHGEADE